METALQQDVKITLGRVVVLVDDYDEAFNFYKNALNARKIFDQVLPDGQRYLHIGFEENATSGIWFLQASTPGEKSRVGKQTEGQPLFVLYTNALEPVHLQLQACAARIVKPPVVGDDFTFLQFQDLYGNEIVLVQSRP
ncbi:VOC family protein [Chryseolinea lacunae]|uniref:VOC family protein n=1 Tax=Chryseolinea lacunae TaxID=2801331 RepID=A0ABS1KKT8_9BACT|nr:VOC family protein [Chryseolinea lacunae]MBL0740085.1 VOC family protein [Chryseolinea lacunae]